MLVKPQHTYLRISEKSDLLTKAHNIHISEKYLSTKAASTHISEKSYLSLSRKFSFHFCVHINVELFTRFHASFVYVNVELHICDFVFSPNNNFVKNL